MMMALVLSPLVAAAFIQGLPQPHVAGTAADRLRCSHSRQFGFAGAGRALSRPTFFRASLGTKETTASMWDQSEGRTTEEARLDVQRNTGIALLLKRRGGGPSASSGLTLLSTIVGYAVIVGGGVFKLPQAARIFRKKSAEGLSVTMYTMESIGTAMSLAFSIRSAFPFSAYGEAFFILLQNIAILAGISIYGQTPKPPVLALGLLVAVVAFGFTLTSAVPMTVVSLLQSLSIPLLNISRIPQLLLNRERKSTGELAPSTLILQAAGNLARIFTTVVQVKNNLFLLSCLVAMVFNGALVAQYFMYGGSKDLPTADS